MRYAYDWVLFRTRGGETVMSPEPDGNAELELICEYDFKEGLERCFGEERV